MGSSWQPGPQVCVACLLCFSSCPPAPLGLPALTLLPPAMGQSFLPGLIISSLPQGPPGVPGPPGPPGMPGLQVNGDRRMSLGGKAHVLCWTPGCAAPPPSTHAGHFSLVCAPAPQGGVEGPLTPGAGLSTPGLFSRHVLLCPSPATLLTPMPGPGFGQLSGTQNLGQIKHFLHWYRAPPLFFAHLLFSRDSFCFLVFLDAGDKTVDKKKKNPCSLGACFLVRGTDNEQDK